MLDASHVEIPPSAGLDLRSFLAAGIASRPSITSRLMSCPDVGTLRPNTHLAHARHRHRPVRDCFFVPLGPGPFARLLKQLSNEHVLIVNGSLSVDRDELEDDRQRLILLNHPADELLIALEWIFDIRHVLSRF